MSNWYRRAATCLLLTGIFVPAVSGQSNRLSGRSTAPKAESDDATKRREARRQWYETAWSPDFMKFMNAAAARERAKHGRKIPGAAGAETTSTTEPATIDASAAAVTGTSWLNIGPNRADVLKNGSYTLNNVTDTGRVRSIVTSPANPNVIYVAFSGGGVWKSVDSGANWQPMTEALGSLSTGFLAMDPANDQVLYLGLGDPFDGTGIGLVKSIDGGATWSAPVYLGTSTRIAQVMVSPANSSVLIAATDKGIFRSADAGATWTELTLATGFTAKPQGWAIDWNGTGFVLTLEANPAATSGTTSGQIWVSNVDGTTWTKASGPTKSTGVGRISVAIAPSNRSIAYAMAAIPNSSSSSDLADLFRSTDGGRTWTALNATANKVRYTNSNTESPSPKTILNGQGWYNHMIMVSPTDANTFYFGGALLMARGTRSSSGSMSYTQVTNWLAQFSLPYVHADFHAAHFDANGNFYVGTDGGIFFSADKAGKFASGWTDDLNNGIASHLIYSVGSSPAATDAVIGGFQDNGTRVRVSNTATFNQYLGGDGFGSHISPTVGTTMLGTLYYTRIYKSTNGGSTFASSSSGITESNTSNAPFYTKLIQWLGDSSGNTMYTHVNLKVYKTTNYAGSWTALGTTGLPTSGWNIRNIGVAKLNSNIVGIAGTGGSVYLTSNGGASWTKVTSPPNNDLSMSYVWFNTFNSNVVYVASVAPNGSANHLWRSDDFGATWTKIDGGGFPAGVPVNAIQNDPADPNTLYAATHLGVYKSADNGATWTRFGAGMPLVETTDIYISDSGSLVRASTFGRGFWQLQPWSLSLLPKLGCRPSSGRQLFC